MGFLQGKRALIVGVASDRSIASGIAEAMAREEAELAYTYQNDKLRDRVEEIAARTGSRLTMPLDVTDDEQIEAVFARLRKEWPAIDVIVHSVAYAPRELLSGSYVDSVTRDGFRVAHEISSYSFVALAKAARSQLSPSAALLTLSYLGAVRTLPSYNVMGPAKASLEANVRFMAADLGQQGARVNAISAGPIKTLAAAGIGGIRTMLHYAQTHSPLRRNVTIEEVGNAAAFLCSDLAAGITGQILYVDAGYHIVGMSPEEIGRASCRERVCSVV
jgi:enoyl-[acyl-carrier protein] reductase I